MFKKIFAPVQAWLLSQGKCVGCGKPLTDGKFEKKGDQDKVICDCGRIYIKDNKAKIFRRALFEEV